MSNLETYEATVKGVKDIHTPEAPVKYWLSVDLDNGTERRLYVEQNCRHIQKGQRVKVNGYPIKKQGSNNQTCVSIDSLDGDAAPTDSTAPTKYRLTMSNLISSWLASGKQLNDDEYNQIDKYVRKILDAQYVTDNMEEAPF